MGRGLTVQEIVVEKLINKIEADGRLPWQKPFQSSCMNWFSKHEYMGINKILLDGGEYITVNQLKQYNESKKVNFWFEKGTPWEIVVFYSKIDRKISDAQARAIIADPNKNSMSVKLTDKGWVMSSWMLKYYRVYNINHIKDKEGNALKPHIGDTVIEEHIPANEIVDKYINETGVRIQRSGSGAYYTDRDDSVFLQAKPTFASTEAYYRVLFHELIHSTGITKRLDRKCYHDYHQGSKERSKEELIAEIGGLLLASEAGFKDDTEWADNSITYVSNWCAWMKDNKNEVLQGMLAAEKAKNYILSGGVKASNNTQVSIDNPNENVTDGEGLGDDDDISSVTDDAIDTDTTQPTYTKKTPSVIKGLKSKKAVKEYYIENLAKFFDGNATDDERKEIFEAVTAIELKHIYYVLTKEKLPASRKKADVFTLIRKAIEGASRIG
jgi:antirestriction protein ArdC